MGPIATICVYIFFIIIINFFNMFFFMAVSDNKLQDHKHSKGKTLITQKTKSWSEMISKMLSVVLTSYSGVWFHTCSLSVNRKSNLEGRGRLVCVHSGT